MVPKTRDTYMQIRDVVEHIRKLHRDLRETYEEKADEDEHGRRELLLRYLSEREKNLRDFLRRYAAAERKTILDTWIQYSPTAQLEVAFREAAEAPLEDSTDVAAQAVNLERSLAQVYGDLEGRSAAANLRRFFGGLREVAETRMRENAESLQQEREL